MIRQRRVRLLALAALASGVAPVRAEPANAEQKPERPSYRVDFSAGKVEVDTRLEELELTDDVVVRVDRYRLTSDRLKLRRGPRGVEVQGSGRVAFCPCPDPPVSIGFSSALVAPPTDVLIEQPTLRIGGVPVLWLPYLWLRSPERVGMLPPRIAWRGEDGLFGGSGVHLPLGTREEPLMLDIAAGGYLKGGADVELKLLSERSSTRARFDHLEQSLLAIDGHGSARGDANAVAAWRVDALRGARGRRAASSLEEASRRYDRARATVGTSDGGATIALGLESDLERGGSLDEMGALGPSAHVGVAGALASVGSGDAWADVRTASGAPTRSIVAHAAELGFDARPGPFALRLELGERIEAHVSERDDAARALGGARARLSLPLVRRFGSSADPLQHWVEPLLDGGIAAVEHEGQLVDGGLDGDASLVHAAAGARSVFGSWSEHQGVELVGRAGLAGPTESPGKAVAGKLAARATWVGASSEAAWLPEQDSAWVVLGATRLGRAEGPHISAHAEGRNDVEPLVARALVAPGWRRLGAGWLDRSGWSVGGAIAVPWARWLASTASVDYDLTARTLLSLRGALAYRHRCGCLAAMATAQKRLGRGGVDAFLTVDLLP